MDRRLDGELEAAVARGTGEGFVAAGMSAAVRQHEPLLRCDLVASGEAGRWSCSWAIGCFTSGTFTSGTFTSGTFTSGTFTSGTFTSGTFTCGCLAGSFAAPS
jgi:hypothetical protein